MNNAPETFARYLAKEVVPKKIRANVVATGLADSDFYQTSGAHAAIDRFKT